MSDDAARRARARATWPVRVLRLGNEPGPDLTQSTAEERVAMLWPLTLAAWSLAGRSLPLYSRREMPVCVRSLADAGDP